LTERIKKALTTDVLIDILDTLRFRSTIFLRSQLAAPWGFSFGRAPTPRFHISLGGDFFVGGDETGTPVQVREMEIALLPRGCCHWVADRPGRPLVPSERAEGQCELERQALRGGTVTHQIMCGRTALDPNLTHPFFASLPEIVHLPCVADDSRIWRMVKLIDAEVASTQSLRSPIINRLTEALFLQLLQDAVEHGREAIGFVAALRDPQLHRVLQLIHEELAKDWTIEDLANFAAMSRATLVRRFRKSVGAAPIEYLTRWRLLKAHQLTKHSAHSIERVADLVGFSNSQTLGRAFKRHFGYPPSRLRGSTDSA